MRPDNVILTIGGLVCLLYTIPFWEPWWKVQGLDCPGSKFRILTDCFTPSFKSIAIWLGMGLAFLTFGLIPIIRDLFLSP